MQYGLHSDPMAEHVKVPTLAPLEPMLIGGSWTAGQARETIPVIDPAAEEVLTTRQVPPASVGVRLGGRRDARRHLSVAGLRHHLGDAAVASLTNRKNITVALTAAKSVTP